ncbi:SlyX family protein [Alteromonas sp. ASW11-36]|uniref:Protein SlyX homolog n=1 Tax=Alteromonas arenosi TaxID=3055817 RepID=A0ABT7T1B8_9ALTE|nr:SlyX family protein [Alteromonas sp. ASW11-36]MDM7862251.1 SlyX family protein [Alteromonas sp. ASW11-36]
MTKQDLQAQIDELQSKLAFQEHTIDSLNEALSTQQEQMIDMERKLKFVIDKIKTLQQSNIASADEETPPPHY